MSDTPIVVLVIDNKGRGIVDHHDQGMPEGFTWAFINPNEPERALEAIAEIEEIATKPEFRQWLAELKERCEDHLRWLNENRSPT
jgi:hypothetical protein